MHRPCAIILCPYHMDSVQEMLDQMQWLAESVVPHYRKRSTARTAKTTAR